MKNYSTLIAQF